MKIISGENSCIVADDDVEEDDEGEKGEADEPSLQLDDVANTLKDTDDDPDIFSGGCTAIQADGRLLTLLGGEKASLGLATTNTLTIVLSFGFHRSATSIKCLGGTERQKVKYIGKKLLPRK